MLWNDPNFWSALLAASLTAATPLLLAASGELVVERAGVLNLGLEGMMLIGAVSAFAVKIAFGNTLLALLAALLAGMAMSALFAVLTLFFITNQVATGLALTIFGTGLSALIGRNYVGQPITPIADWPLPALANLPILGKGLFQHNGLVYLAPLLLAGIAWFLRYSRGGLVLRAIGESAHAAYALGLPVRAWRFCACLFGGAMAGLAGAYLSLAYAPLWAERMTAGRGWIALALVVFATWLPARLFFGAWIFGAISIAQLHAQGFGLSLPAEFLNMLPYLTTILVLALISRNPARLKRHAPADLGKNFHPHG
jgi:general nucleoside transport system permease protein